MPERQGYEPEFKDSGMTRRNFLKGLAATAFGLTAAGKAGSEFVNYVDEKKEATAEASEKRREELLAAPTENIKVAGSAEDLGAEGADTPRCFSELREAAGWSSEYEEEFEKVVKGNNPEGVSDDLQTIYPGIFEVPVNRKSETGLEAAE